MAAPNVDQFDAYFQKADLDRDGRISGAEAVSFFQGSNLPKEVLAQIWMYADQNQTGFLNRQQFYNALKLVTVAQSKRDLTPDIVKAALYSPASAKIPAPRINVTVPSAPNLNNKPRAPAPVTGSAPMMTPSGGIAASQGFPPQQNNFMSPPRLPIYNTTLQSQSGISNPGMLAGSSVPATRAPNSSDWLGSGTVGREHGVVSQFPNRGVSVNSPDGFSPASSGFTASVQPKAQETTSLVQPSSSSSNDSASLGHHPPAMGAQVTGNGIVSSSVFGDVFSATLVPPKQESKQPVSSAHLPVSVASQPNIMPSSNHPLESINSKPPLSHHYQQNQADMKPNQNAPLQSSTIVHGRVVNSGSVQSQPNYQQTLPTIKPNQKIPVQSSTIVHGGVGNSGSVQSQPPWPKVTQADIQKYNKVFVAVDTDRDGKITGEQARNLFLSWRLPRDVLRQVWDLSDQDNDSMLSLREFCIALYLMERYREGRPLPSVLPTSLMLDETLVFSSAKPTAAYTGSALKPTTGPLQHGVKGPRPPAAPLGKPPRPASTAQPDEAKQPAQQKPKAPVLEKHLVDQLSTEEQNSLNLKFQEATDAEKKVSELEKEISDAKEKTHFYHSKMQELILYKSRCENRLNEIIERSSADKKEVESLAKKYEQKYKQAGDVASKLTIEEATFRDIQEKKMELYRTILKMDQDGSADVVQDHANHVQADIEELVKSLNARCKTYGLRSKPISLLELPFGWQPGIQEGAADWDEDWDKFEGEGFTSVKELTLDVPNFIAPPKLKSSLIRDKTHSNESEAEKSNYDAGASSDKLSSPQKGETVVGEDSAFRDEQGGEKSPPKSKHIENLSKEYGESSPRKEISYDGSPHSTQSEHGVESVNSGEKSFDDSGWGASDTHYDAWDINSVASKEADLARHKELSLFGSDDWGLAPIKTGSKNSDDLFLKQSPFFDSVPSTPIYNIGPLGKQNPIFDSVPSTPSYNVGLTGKQSLIFDSVPSTPSYNTGPMGTGDPFTKQSTFFDSVPSTPSYNIGPMGKQSPFFDSVPSTPGYDSGSQQARDAIFSKQSSFFDSVPSTPSHNAAGFSSYAENAFSSSKKSPFFDDSVPSTPMYSSPDHSRDFSRFDSFRSGKDFDYGQDLFASPSRDNSLARFDSFRSTADSEYTFGAPPQDGFTRFDSMRRDSLDYGKGGFPSFDDDDDTFGGSSRQSLKTSLDSETPKRDSSDGWKAF
ncbi:unnamed protein product [Cuscuta epithymum]|uniref:Calmodulin n=1 Tax=Cuscuta epithymum TaxID=186058 RepID=A0AAV0C9S3_9ASTE|nr:unnamed protein product [Cuscuta epithymum]CAH9070288.1 unnamed protein product [Cuscuta epithymum]